MFSPSRFSTVSSSKSSNNKNSAEQDKSIVVLSASYTTEYSFSSEKDCFLGKHRYHTCHSSSNQQHICNGKVGCLLQLFKDKTFQISTQFGPCCSASIKEEENFGGKTSSSSSKHSIFITGKGHFKILQDDDESSSSCLFVKCKTFFSNNNSNQQENPLLTLIPEFVFDIKQKLISCPFQTRNRLEIQKVDFDFFSNNNNNNNNNNNSQNNNLFNTAPSKFDEIGGAGGVFKLCCHCHQEKTRGEFSQNQWKKNNISASRCCLHCRNEQLSTIKNDNKEIVVLRQPDDFFQQTVRCCICHGVGGDENDSIICSACDGIGRMKRCHNCCGFGATRLPEQQEEQEEKKKKQHHHYHHRHSTSASSASANRNGDSSLRPKICLACSGFGATKVSSDQIPSNARRFIPSKQSSSRKTKPTISLAEQFQLQQEEIEKRLSSSSSSSISNYFNGKDVSIRLKENGIVIKSYSDLAGCEHESLGTFLESRGSGGGEIIKCKFLFSRHFPCSKKIVDDEISSDDEEDGKNNDNNNSDISHNNDGKWYENSEEISCQFKIRRIGIGIGSSSFSRSNNSNSDKITLVDELGLEYVIP